MIKTPIFQGLTSFRCLEQRRNIYFSLIRSQSFFFTLRGEHGHTVGEFVILGADMGEVRQPSGRCRPVADTSTFQKFSK